MSSLFKRPIFRFIAPSIGLYILWILVYDNWLHPQGELDIWAIDQIVWMAGGLLQLLGFELTGENPLLGGIRTLGIGGSDGVWIGDPCNGVSLFALFTGFILAFPGPWKTKLWFIPMGILAIHLINVIRVVALVIVEYYYPESLDFNHTYTFTVLVYSLVFVLWYWWIKKFSNIHA
jgi:exosortase family protein XrtF